MSKNLRGGLAMSWMIIFICFGASVLLTPLIRKIALYFDITDKPDQRRINIKPIPSLGGLAIFISFTIGMFYSQLKTNSYGRF